jgi:hypothetical protein
MGGGGGGNEASFTMIAILLATGYAVYVHEKGLSQPFLDALGIEKTSVTIAVTWSLASNANYWYRRSLSL